MSKVVVFDFDGTLTNNDSLLELFRRKLSSRKLTYKVYYYVLKVCAKLKITTVKFEKEQMLKLLFDSDTDTFKLACVEQAKTLKLNSVFSKVQDHLNDGDRVIVLSASSEYLLKEVFKGINVEIIGTTLYLENGKIKSIDHHPFYKEKPALLKEYGIKEVDEMYYDSKWDECLIPMCKIGHKVKNGKIISSF